jgi:L-alanine-DL-glutamate epimerase-like enolase superfamily enzyme
MIVTDIRTLLCHAYRTNWVFVLVETDAGITGLGRGDPRIPRAHRRSGRQRTQHMPSDTDL